RGLCERARDAAAREIDLEGVMRVALGVAQQHVRRASERRGIDRLPVKGGLGPWIAPRLLRDTPEREASLLNGVAIELESNRDKNQSKLIREAVANLQVRVVRSEAFRRQFHGSDDLAGVEVGVALRCIARKPVELRKCDHAVARRAANMDFSL